MEKINGKINETLMLTKARSAKKLYVTRFALSFKH